MKRKTIWNRIGNALFVIFAVIAVVTLLCKVIYNVGGIVL
jgi:hypothetical protein